MLSLASSLSFFFPSGLTEDNLSKERNTNITYTRSRKRKVADVSDEAEHEEFGSSKKAGKKPRPSSSSSNADFALWDVTFVDSASISSDDIKSGGALKKFSSSSGLDKDADSIQDACSKAVKKVGPKINSTALSEYEYDPTNERHEWELSWFICAHHAAFTAATAMSLRHEIRRRKTITRMWKELKKENNSLRSEVERLSFKSVRRV